MKVTSLKLALAAALVSASFNAAASTVDPSDMTLHLWNGSQVYYGNSGTGIGLDTVTANGNTIGDLKDRWTIVLHQNSGLVANFTNATDSTDPRSYLDKGVILDSVYNVLATVMATSPGIGRSEIVDLRVSNLLAGTYYLDIYGKVGSTGLGYSGDISAVPLPGAALLFGSVLLGAGALRRKQAKAGEMAAA